MEQLEQLAQPMVVVQNDVLVCSIRHLLRTLSHGRCIVMQLSPLVRRAVLASEYFLQNREKLCQALLLVFCEDHAVAGIPQ